MERFVATYSGAHRLSALCEALGAALTNAWEEQHLESCLWLFVAGYERGEPHFWYVVNATGHDERGLYTGISGRFRVVNDLDDNYLSAFAEQGLTKAQVLDQRSFQFYNGAIFPGSFILQSFDRMLEAVVRVHPRGFPESFALDRYAFVVRQRMEFLKRLYSPKHGIHEPDVVPLVEGKVYVYVLTPGGEFYEAPKQLGQVKSL